MVTVTPWLTVFTSMFLHGGFWHLLGNMLYLWIFGDNVEDAMGHWRFALFYLLCGAVAGLTHAAVEPASQIPTIGASGAVSGVLGAYFVLHPRRGVWMLIFFMPIRFPAWAVLGVWIGYQVINALADAGGGVAWYAHVRGLRRRRIAGGAAAQARRAALRPRLRPHPQADALPAAAGGRESGNGAMGGAASRSPGRRRCAVAGAACHSTQRRR